ncbi:NADH dehydrogenase [ubiquinone] 1 beta subcomplex subunit 11, mitochondrial [Anoplophora glabripennis]|uniref:NADH dehydrogenase [ubiquinone] 1 beta subcomplex subunit 11, mitochondrial n=1 Tax=Anoplophora glabripennis TaxID=217634 RepID=UPI0008750D17|nr:NADH dehydrogenase [ubiquinone] 1 beta subcomplex subunit 11, mitochondrial [Anoplophora glabripennis]
MAGIVNIQRYGLQRIIPHINRRFVSTSNKNNETATVDVCNTPSKTTAEKNWISYGFDYTTKAGDRNALHSIMFGSITLCLVVGGFFLAYMPDYNNRDWAQREAFLELRRREQNGLPLINPNFVDPSKIPLPSDEELGDTEIII